MEQFAHGWVTGAENRYKSSLVQAGKSDETAESIVRRIRGANVMAAEAAKRAAEALAMAEELAAGLS